MDASFLLRGLVLGFAIAAPVGPIGVLCIRRTLADGRVAGFVSGLGAATADAMYGAMAASGLTLLSDVLIAHKTSIQLGGALFMAYLGVTTFLSVPAAGGEPVKASGLAKAYSSVLLLTLTNPMTILSFMAVFAGLGVGVTSDNRLDAALVVAGVFAGSAAWWLLLSGVVSLVRSKLTPPLLRWVNRGSGLVIIGFAVAILVGLMQG